MYSKLHREAVLTGAVDSFCLVCEYHLRGEGAAEEHVARTVHQKNLDAWPLLDKFAGDCIRKVKKGYFCGLCNLLLPTASRVSLHMMESNHNHNKGVHLIRRIGNHIVISKQLLISDLTWNGIINDTCAICNMEFFNLKLHIADQKHVLSLIQKKVEFGVGDVVFRKIDDLSFHCLICNEIYALSILEIHHNGIIHKTNVQKCQENYHEIIENNKENVKSMKENVQKKNQNFETNNVNETSKATGTIKKTETKPVLSTGQKQKIQKTENLKLKQDTKDIQANIDNIKDNNVETTNKKEQDQNIKATVAKEKQDKETSTNLAPTICLHSQNNGDPKSDSKGVTHSQKSEKHSQEKLFEFVTDFQKNGVSINFETETAFCKKCFKDVKLDLETIQKHIETHKDKDTKAGPNVVHTVDLNNSKTVLNSKHVDSNQTDKATIHKKYNLDQNHNETSTLNANEKEEIIKIDLRKKSGENSDEDASESALIPFTPGTAEVDSVKSELPKETAKGKPDEKININDPAAFAEANKLTFNKTNKNAFCRICQIRVPATIRNMKEHVSGNSHTRKAALATEAEKFVPKKPMARFIIQKSTIRNVLGVDDVILNDKICLTRMSYYMITEQKRLRCQACEVNLNEDEVLRHVDDVLHERAMENTPVVTSLDNEFVREVRPGLFHCGYCNLIVGIFDDVAKHLTCSEHTGNKRRAQARLAEHLPPILAHRRARESLFMRAMYENLREYM